jgi:hypothetical protein
MTMLTQTINLNTSISRHWLDVLEEYHVRHIALDPQHDKKLIEALRSRPEWVVEFANEEAIFFVREGDETKLA